MKFLVRADASVSMGTGHIFRTLTLARQLIAQGHEVRYACRSLAEDLRKRLADEHIQLIDVPDHKPFESEVDFIIGQIREFNIDWVIVDHYAVHEEYYRKLRDLGVKILAVDDINVTKFPIHILVNQNYPAPAYEYQCSPDTVKLLGSKFAIVSSVYTEKRERVGVRRELKNVFLFLGGGDSNNYTLKVMKAMEKVKGNYHMDVVLGAIFQFSEEVRKFAEKSKHQYTIHHDLPDLSDLMSRADLAIGAGGITCWEMCTLYLPMILIPTADNQIQNAEGLSQAGAAVYPGRAGEISDDDLIKIFNSLDMERISQMSKVAGNISDGRGIERISEYLENE